MVIGLKGATVLLAEHETEWKMLADQTIEQLRDIFGTTAKDIQHIGSTAIHHIKAKPIIDIAIGVKSITELPEILPRLESVGIYKSALHAVPNDILYVIGDFEDDIRTHHIHIVEFGSMQWLNYICFRDYLNNNKGIAKQYEDLKIELYAKYHGDRNAYTDGKDEFLNKCLFEARLYAEMRQRFDIMTFEPITKGWSGDKKYYAETADKKQFLIRTAGISQYEQKKVEFENMKRVASLGIPMQQPVDFGVCDDGNSVFLMLTWINGDDAEEIFPLLSEQNNLFWV